MTTTHTNPIAPATIPATSSAVVRRFVGDILNNGRFDVLAEIVHPEYRYEGPDGAPLHGLVELEQLVTGYRNAFSDFRATITSEVENGAFVAMTMMLTGTHDGEFDGHPPTGAHLRLPIAVFTHVDGGRIIEDREFYDTATIHVQLGLGAATGGSGSDGTR